MAGPSPESNGYSERLYQAERDLELAAQIGQSLLEQNKDLQTRNEFLEENLATSSETIVQLNHELNKRIELLRVYSYYDDDDEMGNDDASLRQRIDKLVSENRRLKAETKSLQKEADGIDEKSKKHLNDLIKQIDIANEKIENLHSAIQVKNEECSMQSQSIEKLLHEISLRHNKERKLLRINDEITKQLDEAIERQGSLLSEAQNLQNDYLELKSMFYEAEEELMKFRQQAPHHRSRSFDSVYDSLASELENSDTGMISAPTSYRSIKAPQGFHLNLEKIYSGSGDTIEVDVPSAAFMELSKKTFLIENDLPAVPTQTPQNERPVFDPFEKHKESMDAYVSEKEEEDDLNATESTCSETKDEPIKSIVLCDASTSTDFVSAPFSRHLKLDKKNHLIGKSQPVPIGLNLVANKTELKKSDSLDSLDGYVAPKLGEPGIPGTRDLDFSLKYLKAKLQIEQDFAQFCQRKGLTLRNFCSPGGCADTTRKNQNSDDFVNYSVLYARESQRHLSSPLHAAVTQSLATNCEGVLTRNSLVPGHVQINSSPLETNGLATITGGSIISSGGILKRL
ncbi:unnamed protein product [Auanema sp. JU1783]|nr:unnamed protein product [Auanema sp. JU1783]